jgi:hypothetical protein
VADWVRNDLAMIPKGMPVVFFNHMISNWQDGSMETTGFTFGSKRRVNLNDLCNLTGFVYGHTHQNHFQRRGKTAFINTACPQMGGIGMAPATIRVVRADAKGRLDSTIHYGHVDEWKPERAGAEWEARLPGKVLFWAPVASDGLVFAGTSDDEGVGAASVHALDLATGRIVWSHKMESSINNQMVVSGGILVAQDIEGRVTAFEAKGGRVAWRHIPPIHPWKIILTGLALDKGADVVFAGKGSCLLYQGCRFNILVRCKVVHNHRNLCVVKHRRCAVFLKHVDCHRRGNVVAEPHIQFCVNKLACLYLTESCMSCEDLLCHCHSHSKKNSLDINLSTYIITQAGIIVNGKLRLNY